MLPTGLESVLASNVLSTSDIMAQDTGLTSRGRLITRIL